MHWINSREPPKNLLLQVPWLFWNAPVLVTVGCLVFGMVGWLLAI